MGDVGHRGCLKTYNPENTEEHTDSSDFEDICSYKGIFHVPTKPRQKHKKVKEKYMKYDSKHSKTYGTVDNKVIHCTEPNTTENNNIELKKYHLHLNKVVEQRINSESKENKNFTINNEQKLNTTENNNIELKKYNLHVNKVVQESINSESKENKNFTINNAQKVANSDPFLKATSSSPQHKVINCLSSLLNRGKRKNSIDTHNQKENHEIYYVRNSNKQSETSAYEKLYAIEPVLTIDGNMYGIPVKPYRDVFKQNSYCKSTTSSESSTDDTNSKRKVESCSQTKSKKYTSRKLTKHKEHKHRNDPFIYTSSSALLRSRGTNVDGGGYNQYREETQEPFTDEETWNYVAIGQQEQCHCSRSNSPCNSSQCPYSINRRRNQGPQFTQPNYPNPFPQPTLPTPPGIGRIQCPCCGQLSMPKPQGALGGRGNVCNCPVTVIQQPKQAQLNTIDPNCQVPHDEIVKNLQNKFNRQVLCIHNPPCVLINGCLNITKSQDELTPLDDNTKHRPPPKQEKRQARNKKNVYSVIGKKKGSIEKCDESCQYHPPCIEVLPCEARKRDILREQITQSLCYHDPPCVDVSGCYNTSGYLPDAPCQHIPICPLVPNCTFDREETERQSMWEKEQLFVNYAQEWPNCFKPSKELKGNISTQVKPRTKVVCCHKPPCIMIPKCLSQEMSKRYLPPDVMPDCLHTPRCDLVPSCYRSSREMVYKPEKSASIKVPRTPICYQNKILNRFKCKK